MLGALLARFAARAFEREVRPPEGPARAGSPHPGAVVAEGHPGVGCEHPAVVGEAEAVPAAEYVRAAAVDAAEGKVAALSAAIVETIRRIYRSTHIFATLKRDKMLREGLDEEMEKTIHAARASQASLRKQASE